MGVYISSMEVPKSCNKCRLSYYDQEEGYLRCAVLGRELAFFDTAYKRYSDCPLSSTSSVEKQTTDSEEFITWDISDKSNKKEPFGEYLRITSSPTTGQQWAVETIRQYHLYMTGEPYDKPEFNKQAYHNFINEHSEEYDYAKQWKYKQTECRTYSCSDNTLFDWLNIYDAPDVF